MSDIGKLIQAAGGPAAFARRLGIPIRTVEDWRAGRRKPPRWLPPIIAIALRARTSRDVTDAG